MRLLNIHSYAFREFHGENIPPYLIASHRWCDDETTFKDVLKKRNKESKGWQKVEGFCERARRDNELLKSFENATCCEWIWIDTACIDKKSSAEVSKSINSMFEWYSKAQECHAYMADVKPFPESQQLSAVLDDFKDSEWFKRGWTLQELLAPRCVVFFTQTWQVIGHKCADCSTFQSCEGAGPLLNAVIAEVTGIPEEVLRDYERSKCLAVEERMKWQVGRRTTEIEDQAYCLLGLFDVHMPLLYGEGEKALLRLERTVFEELERPWQSQLRLSFNGPAGESQDQPCAAVKRSVRPGRPLAIMRYSNVDGSVSCVCGFEDDDGYLIACDICQFWQHAVCYYQDVEHESMPKNHEHRCVRCRPRHLDVGVARRQQERKRAELTVTAEATSRSDIISLERHASGDDEEHAMRQSAGKRSRSDDNERSGVKNSHAGAATEASATFREDSAQEEVPITPGPMGMQTSPATLAPLTDGKRTFPFETAPVQPGRQLRQLAPKPMTDEPPKKKRGRPTKAEAQAKAESQGASVEASSTLRPPLAIARTATPVAGQLPELPLPVQTPIEERRESQPAVSRMNISSMLAAQLPKLPFPVQTPVEDCRESLKPMTGSLYSGGPLQLDQAPKRKRGRPTKAEVARRYAQHTPTFDGLDGSSVQPLMWQADNNSLLNFREPPAPSLALVYPSASQSKALHSTTGRCHASYLNLDPRQFGAPGSASPTITPDARLFHEYVTQDSAFCSQPSLMAEDSDYYTQDSSYRSQSFRNPLEPFVSPTTTDPDPAQSGGGPPPPFPSYSPRSKTVAASKVPGIGAPMSSNIGEYHTVVIDHNRHTAERPEKCPIPTCEYHGRGFARKYDLNRHILTHYRGEMTCGFCASEPGQGSRTFNRVDVFKRHLTSVHGVEQAPPNTLKQRRVTIAMYDPQSPHWVQCSACLRWLPNAQDFYDHLDDCILRTVQGPKKVESYTCPHVECASAGVAFRYPRELERHIYARHGESELEMFHCPEPSCGQSFTRKDKLIEHRRSFHGEEVKRRG